MPKGWKGLKEIYRVLKDDGEFFFAILADYESLQGH